MKRVHKIIIGYDINQTVTSFNQALAADDLAAGEVVVLDKNKEILAANKTISDSDVIFIAVGGKNTFTDSTGLSRREIICSSPIQGVNVKSFKGISYSAATEKVVEIAAAGLVPVAGDEYVIRLVYKDMQSETPAQYIQEFRVIAESAVLADLYALFIAKINADVNARVSAANNAGKLRLTAKTVPFSLTQIDDFKLVDFDVRFNHVTPTGPVAAGPAIAVTVASSKGSGDHREVRDIEKACKSNLGITNTTLFPVPTGANDFMVDEGGSTTKTYDFIVIEHDADYISPDLSYTKQALQVTTIALPVGCLQAVDVLAVLNPWMASLPKAFAAVSI